MLGIVALCTLLTACSKREAAADQVLRLSQRNEPATLDPQLATLPDEYFSARALFEGLTIPNPDGPTPLPGVAESWDVSPNSLVWTFRLRADARWSNGDPVTAGDFVWSFQRMLTPALGAAKASLFFPVRNASAFLRGEIPDFSSVGFSAPDDHTLTITLDHPAPYLPALAATGAWLPVHRATVERHGIGRDSRWSDPGNLVGNGPFTLVEWKASQQIELRRNEHYWDRANVLLPAIRLVLFDNNDAEERAFRAGQIDVTMTVPAARLDHYRTEEPMLLRRQRLYETRYLSLNTRRGPLGDPRVREALSLAIDRRALTDHLLKGGQQPANAFIPAWLGGYLPRPAASSPVEPPLTRARRLLAEAGFPEGRGFPRLEFSTWTNTTVLEAIQQMWKRNLGIDTAIVLREARVHLAALGTGTFDVALVPLIPDYDNPLDVLGELLSSSPSNYGGWSSAEYDRLVREASRNPKPPADNTHYRGAEEILLKETPVIPLYFSTQSFLVAPRVRGWRTDSLWNRYYKHVSLDSK